MVIDSIFYCIYVSPTKIKFHRLKVVLVPYAKYYPLCCPKKCLYASGKYPIPYRGWGCRSSP